MYIFAGLPESYPAGFPVDGPEQIPVLKRLSLIHVPEKLCAFDQLSRVQSKESTALHFYRADQTFQRILELPNKSVRKFSDFKAVLTPDCSLTLGMSPSKRAHQTRLSRAAGAIWQSRGLTVIPSLRWADSSDYELVCSGIQTQSIFAISGYASMRDPLLRQNFEEGAVAIVERLQPEGVLVYGPVSDGLLQILTRMTKISTFPTPTQACRVERDQLLLGSGFTFDSEYRKSI